MLALCLSSPICAVTAAAALAEWKEQLAEQIALDLGCEVAFLSPGIDRTVEGRTVVMAKVLCVDKRAFDARRDDDEPFSFRECSSHEQTSC